MLWLGSGHFAPAQTPPGIRIEVGTEHAITITSSANHAWRVGPNSGGSGFGFLDDTAGATRLKIDLNGNVGIGTTSPLSLLHVNGVIRSSTGGFAFPDGTTQTTAASGGQSYSAGAGLALSGNVFSIAPSGVNNSMLAGSAVTGAKIAASTIDASKLTFTPLTSESDPKVATTTVNNVPKWNGSALVNGTITDSGNNVGIGRTSPSAKLDVGGAIAVSGTQVINSSGQWVGPGSTGPAIKSGVVSEIALPPSSMSVSFASAYPNANNAVLLTSQNADASYLVSLSVSAKSSTGFTVVARSSLAQTHTITFYWMTVSYSNP